MVWKPGESGNPAGPPKRWLRAIDRVTRREEFRRAFLRLIQIRDGRIRELDFTEDGKQRWVYPSVSNLIAACVKIMEYTAGKPEQKISLDIINGEDAKPNSLQLVLNRPVSGEIRESEERPAIILSATTDSRSEE